MEKLVRTKQCKGCPWKKSIDINTIPNGLDKDMLFKMIEGAKNSENSLVPSLRIMSCHHSNDKDNMICIGWLHNQLGPGNNWMLRLKMRDCENISEIKVYGKQHEKFEDLIPDE